MNKRELIKKFNSLIGSFYDRLLSIGYDKQYARIMKRQNLSDRNISKLDINNYINYWKRIGRVNPIYYKIFSQYNENINDGRYLIVPENITHNVIENILNPPYYRGYFSDKNMYDKIFGADSMPKTFYHRIQGHFYDSNYKAIELNEYTLMKNLPDYFVVKRTIETSSGLGVRLFKKSGSIWKDVSDGSHFSLHSINEALGEDYIIQEWMKQSPFMSNLCKTSINTLRILVYRSVSDNKVHVLNSVVRIGNDGSFMDNAHQGGVFVGITESGVLKHKVCNQYGDLSEFHNGINFAKCNFAIPNWENVIDFAKSVGEKIPFHRCLNLDVMIDKNGNPRLIEVNISAMSIWIYQFVNGSCFGKYTDEIIDYCVKNKHKIRNEYLFI